ncbi:MAG: sulfatase [Planctomycetota bacterium]
MPARNLLFLAVAVLFTACGGRSEAPRANVVLIVVDTLRGDHAVGAGRDVPTPNLDRLAADGVVFERAFSHTSWTLPSHTALFSSRHPHQTGVLLNAQRIPEDLPLLPEWLAGRGYRTEAVVSLCSLVPAGDVNRIDRGFEAYDDRMRRVLNPADAAVGHMREALDRAEADERPLFLFAHFADPHQPYRAHGTRQSAAEVVFDGEVVGEVQNLAGFDPFRAKLRMAPGENRLSVVAETPFSVKYVGVETPAGRLVAEYDSVHVASEVEVRVQNPGDAAVEADIELWAWDATDAAEARRRYELEVAFFDLHLGAFLDDLRARGLYDDALIVLTADHGEGLGEHGLIDHGLNCFDEQLHVPLIVKPPAGHAARAELGHQADGIARHIDVVPTILHVLDLAPLPGQEGVSLLQPAERVLLAETHAVAVDDYFALRDERRKLLFSPARDQFLLFDLTSDPDEERPIQQLEGRDLDAWMERLRAVAARSADASDVDRTVDDETRAKLEAMGYF